MEKNDLKMVVDKVFLNPDKSVCVMGRLEQGELLPGDILTRYEVSSFLMPIEDVFSISGKTIVIGRVESGVLHVNDTLQIVGKGRCLDAVCVGIELFRQKQEQCKAGDNVGIVVSGISKTDIERGMVMASPGSVQAYSRFICECHVEKNVDKTDLMELMAETVALGFVFRTATFYGKVEIHGNKRSLKSEDSLKMTVVLDEPVVMHSGLAFHVLGKGSNQLMSGNVTEILE